MTFSLLDSSFFFGWEEKYLVWLQHLGEGSFLHSILVFLNNFFSMLGEETICIVIMGFLYWGISKEKGRKIGLIVIATNLCNNIIKNIVRRIRPYLVLNRVDLLRDVDGYSFPSGHSANSAAVYSSCAYEYKKHRWLKYIAICVPVLVAISRNFLGAHWPTDVIVGLIQGLLCVVLVEFLDSKLKNKYVLYLGILLISSAGLFFCKTNDYFTSYGLLVGFIAGTWFEEKYVNFENTTVWYIAVIRTIGGGIGYGILNPVIKLAIGHLFEEGTAGDFAMRVIRYAVVIFLLLGVYPMIFKLENKFFKQTKKHS